MLQNNLNSSSTEDSVIIKVIFMFSADRISTVVSIIFYEYSVQDPILYLIKQLFTKMTATR